MEPYTNMKAQIKLTNSHSIGEVPISDDIWSYFYHNASHSRICYLRACHVNKDSYTMDVIESSTIITPTNLSNVKHTPFSCQPPKTTSTHLCTSLVKFSYLIQVDHRLCFSELSPRHH